MVRDHPKGDPHTRLLAPALRRMGWRGPQVAGGVAVHPIDRQDSIRAGGGGRASSICALPVRRLSDDELKTWREVLERGYEGLVAKDPQSRYVGGRTLKWLKVKVPKYCEAERGWQVTADRPLRRARP